jgi:phage gpG-like protein
MSVEAALQYISGRQTDNQTVDVEIASSAVHDGWAKAARTEWDERKYGAQGASKLTAKGVFDNSAFTTEQGGSALLIQ